MTIAQMRTAPTAAHTDGIKDYIDSSATASATKSLSISADYLRTDVDVLHDDVHQLHGRTRTLDLNERTTEKGNKDVPSLLSELANHRGMAWSDIAELTGVSVSAVRKWRKGGVATPDNRRRLSSIAALLDVLEEKGLVQDPAQGWRWISPLALAILFDLWTSTATDTQPRS